ncbi:MAG: hypothetical protein KDK36_16090 [Leptospiraceae bacterium]|nr:hypothetical protein [Leptospiraceae bacterium]
MKKNLLIILILISNCMDRYTAMIKINNDGFQKISDKSIFIRNIKTGKNEWVDSVYKTNLKRTLKESNLFLDVDYYKNQKDKNSYILDIHFSKYENIRSIHWLYIPGAIFTLTLYIWLGGPTAKNEFNHNFTLKIFDNTGKLKNEISKSFNEENTENWFSLFRNDESSEIRGNMIKQSILELVNE